MLTIPEVTLHELDSHLPQSYCAYFNNWLLKPMYRTCVEAPSGLVKKKNNNSLYQFPAGLSHHSTNKNVSIKIKLETNPWTVKEILKLVNWRQKQCQEPRMS